MDGAEQNAWNARQQRCRDARGESARRHDQFRFGGGRNVYDEVESSSAECCSQFDGELSGCRKIRPLLRDNPGRRDGRRKP